MESIEFARAVARLAEEKKSEDTVILEMAELLYVTDYFVICSAENDRQAKAIANHILNESRDLGQKPLWKDGMDHGQWVVLDYGHIVVHVFRNQERELYELERLWKDAPRVELATQPSAL